ncbi:MAG: hypothetical protein ACM3KR_10945 [Deltaproteobacteria bacterium]
MGVQEELKQFMDLIIEHSEEINKLNLFIKMQNGNKIKYTINRKREMKLAKKEQKRQQKLEKNEQKKGEK